MKKEGTLSACGCCNSQYYAPPAHRDKRKFCSLKCKGIEQSRRQTKDLSRRFWQKVKKTASCWLWTGAKLKTGYGSIRIKNRSTRAHRVAYQISFGEIPERGLILHSCDNKLCVNPSHLRIGNHVDNTIDAIESGLHVVGEKHINAKLSNLDVLIIRAALKDGISGRTLANRFKVCEATISGIKTNRKRRRF